MNASSVCVVLNPITVPGSDAPVLQYLGSADSRDAAIAAVRSDFDAEITEHIDRIRQECQYTVDEHNDGDYAVRFVDVDDHNIRVDLLCNMNNTENPFDFAPTVVRQLLITDTTATLDANAFY